jgi:peptide/nickel transport system substrate-binding protein
VARALAAALAAALLAVPGAGGMPDAETPRRGGTVVLTGAAREEGCLNVFLLCSRAALNGLLPHFVMSTVLPGAFREGPGRDLQPNLVEPDVVPTKKRPFTVTYHIRPEARWSDGKPVTAGDFVFTYETSVSAGVEPHEGYASDLAQVAGVRALDARTVRVVLRSRFGGWRRLFPYVLPQHALAGADFRTVWNDGIDDPRTGRPIGSGPFLLQRWDRGRGITLVRNPRYWRGRSPYLDRIVYRLCRDCGNATDEAIEALRQGALDLVHGVRVSGSQIRAFRQLGAGVTVQTGPGPFFEQLAFRTEPPGHPALQDKWVRRAIAHAIDRTALVRALFPGIDTGLRSDNAFFAVGSRHYRPNWGELGDRPTESARLFRRADCRRGEDGIYVCPGGKLTLRAYTVAGVAVREEALRIVTSRLRRAGVELVPKYVPGGPLFNQLGRSGDFDVMLLGFRPLTNDGNRDTNFRCDGAQNSTGYCQRLVDRDLGEASRVLDADLRADVINRADARIAIDVPILPLFHNPLLGVARASLRGYTLAESDNPFIGAENWWLAR